MSNINSNPNNTNEQAQDVSVSARTSIINSAVTVKRSVTSSGKRPSTKGKFVFPLNQANLIRENLENSCESLVSSLNPIDLERLWEKEKAWLTQVNSQLDCSINILNNHVKPQNEQLQRQKLSFTESLENERAIRRRLESELEREKILQKSLEDKLTETVSRRDNIFIGFSKEIEVERAACKDLIERLFENSENRLEFTEKLQRVVTKAKSERSDYPSIQKAGALNHYPPLVSSKSAKELSFTQSQSGSETKEKDEARRVVEETRENESLTNEGTSNLTETASAIQKNEESVYKRENEIEKSPENYSLLPKRDDQVKDSKEYYYGNTYSEEAFYGDLIQSSNTSSLSVIPKSPGVDEDGHVSHAYVYAKGESHNSNFVPRALASQPEQREEEVVASSSETTDIENDQAPLETLQG